MFSDEWGSLRRVVDNVEYELGFTQVGIRESEVPDSLAMKLQIRNRANSTGRVLIVSDQDRIISLLFSAEDKKSKTSLGEMLKEMKIAFKDIK